MLRETYFGYGTSVSLPSMSSASEVVALVDVLPIPALVALDTDVSAAYVNVAMRRLLGIPSAKDTINFRTAPYHLMQGGRRLSRDEAPLYRAVAGNEIAGEALDFELHDGRTISVLAFAAPIRETDGRITGAIASFMDVTYLRLSEQRSSERLITLTRAGQELSEALNAEAVFNALVKVLIPRAGSYLAMITVDEEERPSDVYIGHKDVAIRDAIEAFRESNKGLAENLEIAARVARTNRPEVVGDREELLANVTSGEEHRNFLREFAEVAGIESLVVLPMRIHGRTLGVLAVACDRRNAYDEDDVRMLAEIGRRAATALQNAELFLHHEQSSKTLQEALLPALLPKVPGIKFDAIYAPGDDRALIGGDWYDAFELPDGRIAVSIGDVTGRGTKAAAIMGKVRQTISGLSFYESDPVKLLDVAELALLRRHPDALVTSIVGVLDPRSGEFVYATAGHPPPMLRRTDGTVLMLPCHGLPLGLRASDEDHSSVTFRLLPGDTLLLYTDGLTEVEHDPVEGEDRTRSALASLPSYRTDAARYIQETILPHGSRDDVALLTLQFDPYADDMSTISRRRDAMEIKFNARDARMAHDMRGFITDFLREYGEPDEAYDAAETVLGELLSNAVRHAAGPIEMHLSWTGEYPELSMLDYGPAYGPALAIPEDPWIEGGRGLYIIGLLTRAFRVTRLFGGVNEAHAELDIHRRS